VTLEVHPQSWYEADVVILGFSNLERQAQNDSRTSTVCREFASFVSKIQLAVRDVQECVSATTPCIGRDNLIFVLHHEELSAAETLQLETELSSVEDQLVLLLSDKAA
jgi:hypothetical protein